MKTSFLEYYKLIIEKVSFDRNLLNKEYKKALSVINDQERIALDNWLKMKGLYPENSLGSEILLDLPYNNDLGYSQKP